MENLEKVNGIQIKNDVTDITNGEGIPYKMEDQIFTKWIDTELGTLKFKPGELDGTINDFDKNL